MIEVGQIHNLIVIKKEENVIWVGNEEEIIPLYEKDDRLNEIDSPLQIGDLVKCFVYHTTREQKIATLREPMLTIGKVAALKVVSMNRLGAFLNWGLEKDLFLPYKQQACRIHVGETHLVSMYIDKSNRLCATMKFYDLLSCDSPYKVNDEVNGVVYNIKEAFGVFVAVDGCYHGLIPVKELYESYKVGQIIKARVRAVKADGKLELTTRKPVQFQMEDDVRKLMELLEVNEGVLKLHDKSSPDEIKALLHMSKAAFKRAAGRLMKEGVIEMKSDGIYRNW